MLNVPLGLLLRHKAILRAVAEMPAFGGRLDDARIRLGGLRHPDAPTSKAPM